MEFDDISAREMPHSIEAEQTVLGAVLLDSELLGTVMNYVAFTFQSTVSFFP